MQEVRATMYMCNIWFVFPTTFTSIITNLFPFQQLTDNWSWQV